LSAATDDHIETDLPPREAFRAGFRAGIPFAAAGFFLSLSFGVLATGAGVPALAAIAMSVVVFAGSAQFAAISIVAAGGGIGAAVSAGALMNSRFLPMGIALAPSLPGRALSRAGQGQAVVDSSWAMALREGGRFDRWFLFGSTAIQYATWQAGTLVGALGGDALPDADTLGLDAIYPTFFLALLFAELRNGTAKSVAALGAVIALVLVPITPPGVPVLVASVAAFYGLRHKA
jgi:4-azaleucine resistance transporter AzlC